MVIYVCGRCGKDVECEDDFPQLLQMLGATPDDVICDDCHDVVVKAMEEQNAKATSGNQEDN